MTARSQGAYDRNAAHYDSDESPLIAPEHERVVPETYLVRMPRISAFSGITITITILMFFGDHNPPHFHARYSGHVGRVALDGTFLDGDMPRRAKRLIRAWAALHHRELELCWERAVRHEPPGTIEPLP